MNLCLSLSISKKKEERRSDKVRISLVKRPFEKRMTKIWNEEIFKVMSMTTSSQGISTYTLEDTMGESVEGTFS